MHTGNVDVAARRVTEVCWHQTTHARWSKSNGLAAALRLGFKQRRLSTAAAGVVLVVSSHRACGLNSACSLLPPSHQIGLSSISQRL